MPLSDTLKSFRKEGYGDKKKDKEEGSSVRVLKLSDEEKKALEGYGAPGEEISCQVSGRLEGDHFHVMSVSVQAPEPSQADMQQVAGMPPRG